MVSSVVSSADGGCFLCCAGCPAEGTRQECRNPFKAFQGCMRQLTVDSRPVDLIMVQQRLLGNYSHLQIDMCGIIDRSDLKAPFVCMFIQEKLTLANAMLNQLLVLFYLYLSIKVLFITYGTYDSDVIPYFTISVLPDIVRKDDFVVILPL